MSDGARDAILMKLLEDTRKELQDIDGRMKTLQIGERWTKGPWAGSGPWSRPQPRRRGADAAS